MLEAPLLLRPDEVDRAEKSSVIFLDTSWFMPNVSRKGRDEFDRRRIPQARFLDLDEVADRTHELGLPHMMPTAKVFAEACGKLGIRPTSHVILYDTHGVFSSPRALFMFKAFGHKDASVLDGGLPLWEKRGLPIEIHPPEAIREVGYPTPSLDNSILRSYGEMSENARSEGDKQTIRDLVIDARSAGRFSGALPEPRPGLPSGHIPHSYSLPFSSFLKSHSLPNSDTSYTTFLPPSDIREQLQMSIGADEFRNLMDGKCRIVTTCGSGMTAAILWLGLKLIGVENAALYDESWMGYAARSESIIEKA